MATRFELVRRYSSNLLFSSSMTAIHILQSDPNRRGDLFGRLMADLFIALGYEQPHLNIHKSGREVDLKARHRLEPRQAVGECKATADAIGGADLNKFVGVLDAEGEVDISTSGYFISLGGFTETALEQERNRRTKIVTLDANEVIDELVKGRIIIGKERATELAGRCCVQHDNLVLDPSPELAAHERGWVWVVYYTTSHERSHFVLIHADGTFLASALANEIIKADRGCGGALHGLKCLNPKPSFRLDDPAVAKAALSAYELYVSEECGYIHLDGLPADSDVGSRRLRLETLFVPLHLDINPELKRQKAGTVLAEHSRLALLAAPGGGKSTLVKRLAVAYANPQRRSQASDDLPNRMWFPLFFRCRELRGLARGSFADLLEALSLREPVRQYSQAFRALVDRALSEGTILFLVDGLDEISDPGDRAAFVCTMRTALQAYPGTSILVTSREAGFRHVAAHLAPICTQVTLSQFNDDDIRHLSVAWHVEVVGDTAKVRTDAEALARTIMRNNRIKQLAGNPLLLTTLLLVKRWVGSLPTRRAILYGKAVEVLLMTWNTEGHAPIPEEEALPQLCFVASAMMVDKVERISRPRLATLLKAARDCLPAELGYVNGTVEEFIHRVEDRSSLLMMTGHDVEDGRLVEFFEFRHLTFQEFLTARAVVQGWHLGRNDCDTLATVLETHFFDEKWREVIPLAASFGGKATEDLIKRLTDTVRELGYDDDSNPQGAVPSSALVHCLADEAPARPETIRAAMDVLVRVGARFQDEALVAITARGRYGKELRESAERAILSKDAPVRAPVHILHILVWHQAVGEDDRFDTPQLAKNFLEMLRNPDLATRCKGALGYAGLIEHDVNGVKSSEQNMDAVTEALLPLLYAEDDKANYVAGWLFFNLGGQGLCPPPAKPDVLERMFNLWRHSKSARVRSGLATTFANQLLVSRDESPRCVSIDRREVEGLFAKDVTLDDDEKIAALIAAWYTRAIGDSELVAEIFTLRKRPDLRRDQKLRELAAYLGVIVQN